jgi:branched-chain amino acid transport system permease protein
MPFSPGLMVTIGVVAVGTLAVPVVLGEYWAYVLSLAYIHVLLALGLNFLLGYAGQFSFGHAALYGLGAYATGLAMVRWQLPFALALVLAVIVTVAVSLVIAVPALRVSGVYLGIITVGFVELFVWAANHWRAVTFGPSAFSVPAPRLFGVELNSSTRTYYLVWAVTVALTGVALVLVKSRLGRALVATRDGEVAAEALGLNVTRYKIIAFALNAAYAGVAGGLYAVLLNYVSPGTFGLDEAISQFNMVVVGGIGTLLGPVVGALGLTLLFELRRGATGLQEILSGLFLVVFVLLLPRGIVGELAGRGWVPREKLYAESAGRRLGG